MKLTGLIFQCTHHQLNRETLSVTKPLDWVNRVSLTGFVVYCVSVQVHFHNCKDNACTRFHSKNLFPNDTFLLAR